MPNESLVLDRVFHALSNHTRRDVLARLEQGPASMTELAEPYDMALPSFLQHLQVLENEGMISSKKTGRVRIFQLEPGRLLMAERWIDTHRSHWKTRLDQLDSLLMTLKDKNDDTDQTPT